MRQALRFRFYISFFLLSSFILSCTNELEDTFFSFEKAIVVDASFTNEFKRHEVRLSYTSAVESSETSLISNATVFIEDDLGGVIRFVQASDGVYLTENMMAGEAGRSYKLVFTIEGGKTYESTYESLVPSPEIDNVSFRPAETPSRETNENIRGFQFFIDSDDPTGEANYFRYEWNDAKQTIVPYPAKVKIRIEPDPIHVYDFAFILPETEDVETCYRFGNSSNIVLSNTVGSTGNEVRDVPVKFTPFDYWDFMNRYSIEIAQYAISRRAHDYYGQLKLFNESNGSLFDQQQGVVVGNIESVDDNEVVLGYFEVAGVSKTRRFYDLEDLNDQATDRIPSFCETCATRVNDDVPLFRSLLGSLITNGDIVFPSTRLIEGFKVHDYRLKPTAPQLVDLVELYFASNFCTDCRLYGEIVEKPAYWID